MCDQRPELGVVYRVVNIELVDQSLPTGDWTVTLQCVSGDHRMIDPFAEADEICCKIVLPTDVVVSQFPIGRCIQWNVLEQPKFQFPITSEESR